MQVQNQTQGQIAINTMQPATPQTPTQSPAPPLTPVLSSPATPLTPTPVPMDVDVSFSYYVFVFKKHVILISYLTDSFRFDR